jgi:hypothetical protein
MDSHLSEEEEMAKHELVGAKITAVRRMTNTEQTQLYGYPVGAIDGPPTVMHVTLATGEEVGLMDREGNTFYAEHWANTIGGKVES